jgi:hypothetical protein
MHRHAYEHHFYGTVHRKSERNVCTKVQDLATGWNYYPQKGLEE